jgi:hypothetical protein
MAIAFGAVFAIAAMGKDNGEDFGDVIEQIAVQIPFLDTNHILHDCALDRRDRDLLSDNEQQAVDAFWRMASSETYEQWLPLLTHDHAKVRTLAVAALYLQGGHKWLPEIVEMTTDTGKTFQRLNLVAAPRFTFFLGVETAEEKRKRESFTDQTVGQFARAIVGIYMGCGGDYRVEDTETVPGFSDYWDKHKNREHCLGWFFVSLRRASNSCTHHPGREAHFKKLRNEIDSVAQPNRDYVLFFLGTSDNTGCGTLVPPDELMQVAKRLGAERMMDLLRGKLPTDAPVFVPGAVRRTQFGQTTRFILEHPTELLRPADAEELLLMSNKRWANQRIDKRDFVRNWWPSSTATAAAELNRAQAKEILLDALSRCDNESGRANITQSLWIHDGMNSAEVIVDWFYSERMRIGNVGGGRHQFADFLSRKNNRPLLAEIINDKRFHGLQWGMVSRLARALNKVCEEEVIIAEEIRAAHHPLGESRYTRISGRMRYPKETAELETMLTQWRVKMIAAVQNLPPS